MSQSSSPVLRVNTSIVRSNLQKMCSRSKSLGLELRPHFKTHQSKDIGNIFREFDIEGITVSSLKMAKYFVEDDWNNITIAFPFIPNAIEHYNNLAGKCHLKTIIQSLEVFHFIESNFNEKMELYIEIDPDYGRSGIHYSDIQTITKLLQAIERSQKFDLAGFYCHAGHTYKARSQSEITNIATAVIDKLSDLNKEFKDIPICYGDTPSCSVLNNFGPVTQLSPGNFIFYDMMQTLIGSCTTNEIAIKMECQIVNKFIERNQLLIHGGAIHFSKDCVQIDNRLTYGIPVSDSDGHGSYISSLSQEHGLLQCTERLMNEFDVGDTIDIYPVHSCLTADLMRQYYDQSNNLIDHMNGAGN